MRAWIGSIRQVPFRSEIRMPRADKSFRRPARRIPASSTTFRRASEFEDFSASCSWNGFEEPKRHGIRSSITPARSGTFLNQPGLQIPAGGWERRCRSGDQYGCQGGKPEDAVSRLRGGDPVPIRHVPVRVTSAHHSAHARSIWPSVEASAFAASAALRNKGFPSWCAEI
jgi:hypothetical protein